jgi:hypothetical protein
MKSMMQLIELLKKPPSKDSTDMQIHLSYSRELKNSPKAIASQPIEL